MIFQVKQFFRKYYKETWVLIAAFAFALAGDLIYGNVAGAEASLVGIVFQSTSYLFSSVFLIMVIFKLVAKIFNSDAFCGTIKRTSEENTTKSTSKKK